LCCDNNITQIHFAHCRGDRTHSETSLGRSGW
jgi:hypothetical protein